MIILQPGQITLTASLAGSGIQPPPQKAGTI
jgi:hypothetical protein